VRRAGPLRYSGTEARALLGGGAKLHLNAIGSYAATSASILILNHFRPAGETGHFHFAMQLVTAMQVVPAAFSMVAYTLAASQGPDQAWPRHRVLLAQGVGLVVAGGAVLYAAAPRLIPLLAGPGFEPSVALFRILLLSVAGMTFSTIMASQWIMRGLFVQVSALSVCFGLLNAGANYLLVPRYGAYAAAWVAVGLQALAVLVHGSLAVWIQIRCRTLKSAHAA
jgi:O-antigen/teichoic acid export membrane protein